MSASHHRRFRGVLATGALLAAVVVAGCASHGTENIKIPDQSLLDPATEAMDEAVSSNADQLAPHVMGNARRRVAVARDILFRAARANRSVSSDEQDRIEKLVDQARLDAKAALTKAQAEDVMRQLEQFQTEDEDSMGGDVGPEGGGSVPAGPGMGGPGPAAPGPQSAPGAGGGGNGPAPGPDTEDDQMQQPEQGPGPAPGAGPSQQPGGMGGMP